MFLDQILQSVNSLCISAKQLKLDEESLLNRETHLWHKAGKEGPKTPWAGYKSLGVSTASVGMG